MALAPVDDGPASLTAEHMMRGRQRAREILLPAIAEAARANGGHHANGGGEAREAPSVGGAIHTSPGTSPNAGTTGSDLLRSLLSAASRRDLVLALVWVAIYAGCFLLVRWSGS